MAETVGEYFVRLAEAEDLSDYMFILAFDQFQGETHTYPHWKPLLAHVESVIAEFSDQPFRGPATCAMVMNAAMKRLKAQENVKAPYQWVPTLRTLRAMGEQPVES